MGIIRLDSPAAPFTFVFPDMKNPSLMGEPRASTTAGSALARANASLYTSVDFIALKTITSIDPTNTRNSSAMLTQPNGTNHFQFRFHQFGFGIAGCVSDWSTGLFYFSDEALCNASVQGLTRIARAWAGDLSCKSGHFF